MKHVVIACPAQGATTVRAPSRQRGDSAPHAISSPRRPLEAGAAAAARRSPSRSLAHLHDACAKQGSRFLWLRGPQ